MPAYINGMGALTHQGTFSGNDNFLDIRSTVANRLSILEPNYKDFFNVRVLRRMSRIIKMGSLCAHLCLKDANIDNPGAIIVGTGLGCVEDTEKLLTSLIKNDEKHLNPTPFIQSTHNTVAAQIALQLGCKKYNFTYVHKNFSFESALLDALIHIDEGQNDDILVGGLDEMTDDYFDITRNVHYWRKEPVNNCELITSKDEGTVSGEGAGFFLLSSLPSSNSHAKLEDVELVYKPLNSESLAERAQVFLKRNGLDTVDLLLLGANGDINQDFWYEQFSAEFAPQTPFTYFKQLCGEYYTASAFGFWLASAILSDTVLPAEILPRNIIKPIKSILIYNQWRGINHTLTLLTKT